MDTPRLYLNLIPESLVASMLDPQAYGSYLAVGIQGKTRGEAIFFEVDPALAAGPFHVECAFDRCRTESLSEPKHSVYLAIYRVLERMPLAALGRLHLVTDDGRTLALNQGTYIPEVSRPFHLYQEIAPVNPLVVSRLDPLAFCRHLTTPDEPVSLPRIAFAELVLHEFAIDPVHAEPGNLPYPQLEHLRNCLLRLVKEPEKKTKLVIRNLRHEILYRTVRGGIFVGDQDNVLHYPLPSREVLQNSHRDWWRSAETVHMD